MKRKPDKFKTKKPSRLYWENQPKQDDAYESLWPIVINHLKFTKAERITKPNEKITPHTTPELHRL